MHGVAPTHQCPVEGCNKEIAFHHLMCGRHWNMVPFGIQGKVKRAWNSGKGYGTQAHVTAIKEATDAVNLWLKKEGY